MDTRPRVWNSAHVVQQATHLSERERLVGFHGSSARVHEGDVVFFRLDGLKRPTVKRKILEQVKEKRLDFLARQQLRRGVEHPFSFLVFQMEPEGFEPFVVGIDHRRLPSIQFKLERCKSLLRFPCLSAVAKPLVSNAFVKGVLVHQEQFALCLNQDVRVGKLSQRFHGRKLVEHAIKRGFCCRGLRLACTSVAVEMTFCGGQVLRDGFTFKIRENGLTQWRGRNRAR